MEKLYLRSLASLSIVLLLALSMALFHTQEDEQISHEEIRWYHLEEAEQIAQELDKPMFVYVYTKWCQDCPKMDKTTFREKNIIQYINKNYIPVRLNADDFNTVRFAGHHLSVRDMTSSIFGVDVYPSVIWFESKQKPKPVELYIEPSTFKSYLKYYNPNTNPSTLPNELSSRF